MNRLIKSFKVFVSAFNHRRLVHQHGFTLVEILVAFGIMAIIFAATLAMFSSQQRETKALSEKLAVLDLEKILIAALADGTSCQYILNNPTPLPFNSNAVSSGTPGTIIPTLPIYYGVSSGVPGPVVAQVGMKASPASNSVFISNIKLNITSGSGNSYLGNWEIDFDGSKTVRQLKPIRISTTLAADITVPAAAVVKGCMQGSGMSSCTTITVNTGTSIAIANCPAGYTVTGGGCSGFWPGANSVPQATGWYCSNTTQVQGGIAYAVCCK